jgi:hypothetical protein
MKPNMNRRIQIIRRTVIDTSDLIVGMSHTHTDNIVRVYGCQGFSDAGDLDREQLLMVIAQVLTNGRIDTRYWSLNGKPITDHYAGDKVRLNLTGAPQYRHVKRSSGLKVTGIEILIDAGECMIEGRQHWKTTVKTTETTKPLYGYGEGGQLLTSAELLAEAANTLIRRYAVA